MDGIIRSQYDDISVFLAVAKGGSFVGAAQRLGLPTSTVSRRIAELESGLGVQLLRRTTRRVSLTEAGQAYADRCSALFDEIDEVTQALVEQDAGGRLRGRLRVTAPMLAGADTFGPWLFEFAAKHPDLRLELLVTNAFLDLVEEGIDLAFRLGPIPETRDITRRLWSVPYVLCASPSFVVSIPPLAHPSELDALRLVITPPIHGWCFVDEKGDLYVLRPAQRTATTITDLTLGAAAARSGLGLAYLPLGLVENHIRTGALLPVTFPGWRPLERDMNAVYPPGRQLSAKVRGAINHVLAQRQRHPNGRVTAAAGEVQSSD